MVTPRNPRRTRAPKIGTGQPIQLPDMPPKSAAELADDRQLIAQMKELAAELRQLNLTRAVLLAQQAAAGRGPLVEHFAELGRRYVHLLDAPQKPNLSVIVGGRAERGAGSSKRREPAEGSAA